VLYAALKRRDPHALALIGVLGLNINIGCAPVVDLCMPTTQLPSLEWLQYRSEAARTLVDAGSNSAQFYLVSNGSRRVQELLGSKLEALPPFFGLDKPSTPVGLSESVEDERAIAALRERAELTPCRSGHLFIHRT
jgi:hypothetical protein